MKLLTSRIESGDKSGIQDLLQGMNVLTWFTELREKTLVFPNKQKCHSDDESDVQSVHVVYHNEPPPKRRRV